MVKRKAPKGFFYGTGTASSVVSDGWAGSVCWSLSPGLGTSSVVSGSCGVASLITVVVVFPDVSVTSNVILPSGLVVLTSTLPLTLFIVSTTVPSDRVLVDLWSCTGKLEYLLGADLVQSVGTTPLKSSGLYSIGLI